MEFCMTVTVPTRLVLACCWSIFCGTGAKSDEALDVLVRAYPEQLAAHDGQQLIWKDGTRQPISDGRPNKTFDELLNHPSIIDQFEIPYRLLRPPCRRSTRTLGAFETRSSLKKCTAIVGRARLRVDCGRSDGCPIAAAERSWRPRSTELPTSWNRYRPSLRSSPLQ